MASTYGGLAQGRMAAAEFRRQRERDTESDRRFNVGFEEEQRRFNVGQKNRAEDVAYRDEERDYQRERQAQRDPWELAGMEQQSQLRDLQIQSLADNHERQRQEWARIQEEQKNAQRYAPNNTLLIGLLRGEDKATAMGMFNSQVPPGAQRIEDIDFQPEGGTLRLKMEGGGELFMDRNNLNVVARQLGADDFEHLRGGLSFKQRSEKKALAQKDSAIWNQRLGIAANAATRMFGKIKPQPSQEEAQLSTMLKLLPGYERELAAELKASIPDAERVKELRGEINAIRNAARGGGGTAGGAPQGGSNATQTMRDRLAITGDPLPEPKEQTSSFPKTRNPHDVVLTGWTDQQLNDFLRDLPGVLRATGPENILRSRIKKEIESRKKARK